MRDVADGWTHSSVATRTRERDDALKPVERSGEPSWRSSASHRIDGSIAGMGAGQAMLRSSAGGHATDPGLPTDAICSRDDAARIDPPLRSSTVRVDRETLSRG